MKKYILLLFFVLITIKGLKAQDRNLVIKKAATDHPTNQKRKAIVIGMSNYIDVSHHLNNTLNDADDMADIFTRLGFDVTLLKDYDKNHLDIELNNWYNSIQNQDMVVFYYAGHGTEFDNVNYLVPIDCPLDTKKNFIAGAMNLDSIKTNIAAKGVQFKLLIIDACRDDNITSGWRSLSNDQDEMAYTLVPEGTLIAFSTKKGALANDGGNYGLHNGLFTSFLKQSIMTPYISVDEIFARTSEQVMQQSHNIQRPFVEKIASAEDFYFIPPTQSQVPAEEQVYNLQIALGLFTGTKLNDGSTTFNGHGKVTLANGTIFEGDIKNDNYTSGKVIFTNGDIYEGRLVNFAREDTDATYTWPNGDFYKGGWQNGYKSGKGTLVAKDNRTIANCPDGKVYIGNWADDKKNGNGAIYNKNDTLIYDGNFKDDNPTDPYPNTKVFSSQFYLYIYFFAEGRKRCEYFLKTNSTDRKQLYLTREDNDYYILQSEDQTIAKAISKTDGKVWSLLNGSWVLEQ